MTPVWSPEAINDLVALRAYIEQDDPAAAQRVALHIVQNIETLLEMGRPGRVKCNALCGCWIILFDVGTERDEVIDCLGRPDRGHERLGIGRSLPLPQDVI